VVADGQSATLHVGDKYPIPTSLYSGASQSTGPAAYNPIGQVTQEDLGLTIKILPHVHGDGDIDLALEANFETLGNIVLNSVPSVNERGFKGELTVEEGEWAIVAGMEQDSRSVTKSGIPGLSDIPGLGALFTQTTRDHSTSNTLVVIKPTITRLPMSAEISPQFLLGSQRGARVLL
jgi:general secretion pathway protein D